MAKRRQKKLFDDGHDKELDGIAENYEDARDERLRANKAEREQKNSLIAKMIEKGLTRYETESGLVVRTSTDYGVSVKRVAKDDTSEESE